MTELKNTFASDSQKDEKELINDAINTTLSRTINVSFGYNSNNDYTVFIWRSYIKGLPLL
ncbi:MAG: hypothetical protein U0T81_01255 [Saprospiraceae bacterium]